MEVRIHPSDDRLIAVYKDGKIVYTFWFLEEQSEHEKGMNYCSSIGLRELEYIKNLISLYPSILNEGKDISKTYPKKVSVWGRCITIYGWNPKVEV